MRKDKKNLADKEGIEKIHKQDNKLIYIGTKDTAVIEAMEQLFPDNVIFLMDKSMCDKVTEMIVDFQVGQGTDEEIRKKKFDKQYMEGIMAQFEAIKTLSQGKPFFTLMDLVNADGAKANEKEGWQGLSYKELKHTLEVLFLFGLVVKKPVGKIEHYMLTGSIEDQIVYLEECKKEKENEVSVIDEVLSKMYKNKSLQDATKDMRVVKEIKNEESSSHVE